MEFTMILTTVQSPLKRIKNLQLVPEANVKALEEHFMKTYVPAMVLYRRNQAKAQEEIRKIPLLS